MHGEAWNILLIATIAVAAVGMISGSSEQPTSTVPAASQPTSRAANPHWSNDGCRYCHELKENRVLPIAPRKVNELCWQCHDGLQAAREVHPVGRIFAGEQVRRPDNWPAPGNALSCLTCHDVRLACDRPQPRLISNGSFLRPVSGQGPLAFCGECHVAAFRPDGGRFNVHLMLDHAGRPDPDICRYCHLPSFKLDGSPVPTGDPQLRTDGISLCAVCHTSHLDYFEPGHIGHDVADPMRTRMLIFEPLPWSIGQLFPLIQPADMTMTRLPLENDQRIVCATCHNPHQKGTFPSWSVLADGADAPGLGKTNLRLRGFDKDSCYVCHE